MMTDESLSYPVSTPRYLYKYRAWDLKRSKHCRDILTKKELFFSRPSQLNDPFEGRIQIRYDLPTDDEFERILLESSKCQEFMSQSNLPEKTMQARMDEVRFIRENSGFRDPDPAVRWKALDAYCAEHDNNYGILSLSGLHDSLLQWSHYADNHQGYCVEIDALRLAQLLVDSAGSAQGSCGGPEFWGPRPVTYLRFFPLLIPTSENVNQLFIKRLTTKYEYWQYEREFRCISIGKTEFSLPFTKNLITGIIFGCKMNQRDQAEVIEIISDWGTDIKLVQAVAARSSFSLEFEPV